MLKKFSYQLRLYISFSLTIIIVLAICAIIFYHYNSKLLRQGIEENTIDSLSLFHSRIEDKLTDMDKIIKRIHASESFMDLITKADNDSYFRDHPSVTASVKSIFASSLSTENNYSSIYYTSQYGESTGMYLFHTPAQDYSYGSPTPPLPDYIYRGLSTDEYRFFLPPHPNPWSRPETFIFTAARPIRDTYRTYGVLEYNMDVAELENLLSYNNNDIKDMILLDSEGRLLYTTLGTDEADIAALLPTNNLLKDNGFYYIGKSTLMCYTHSQLTGWDIFIRRDLHALNIQVWSLARMISIFYITGVLLILSFLLILTRNLTRPLRQLKESLFLMEQGEKIVINTATGNNEVTVLTVAIKDILNRLQQQNQQLMESKKRILQAHYDTMEAQLNPHFLYNTLSVIGSYGMEIGSESIPRMCSELASLLRYTISLKHQTVLLKDELKNIESYLFIMKMRYEHMLEYDWDLDSSLDPQIVPKLILQPIVENCFQHGFNGCAPTWKIHIRSWQQDGRWFVSVTNNGVPIDPSKIDELYERFHKFKDQLQDINSGDAIMEQQGFGLENTILRLSIFYHGNEHFSIESKNQRTTIEIGGPINENTN